MYGRCISTWLPGPASQFSPHPVLSLYEPLLYTPDSLPSSPPLFSPVPHTTLRSQLPTMAAAARERERSRKLSRELRARSRAYFRPDDARDEISPGLGRSRDKERAADTRASAVRLAAPSGGHFVEDT